jgi:signal transduction histidine kinase
VSQDHPLPPQVVDSLIRREQLSRAGRLLRGTVHNLSGALQTLRLPLDLMEMQAMKGGEQDLGSKMGALQQGVSRLGGELEMLAGLSQQLHRVEAEPLNLCELAQEQLDFWSADMFFKHEVQLSTELPQPAPRTQAAYADIAMALNILLANAVESLQQTEKRGLHVSLIQDGDWVGLKVVDDGPGPPPDVADKMFEPFVGGKEPDHDGLGLFLAKAALSRWGGELGWTGDPPGAFELRLPKSAD